MCSICACVHHFTSSLVLGAIRSFHMASKNNVREMETGTMKSWKQGSSVEVWMCEQVERRKRETRSGETCEIVRMRKSWKGYQVKRWTMQARYRWNMERIMSVRSETRKSNLAEREDNAKRWKVARLAGEDWLANEVRTKSNTQCVLPAKTSGSNPNISINCCTKNN